MFNPFLKPRLNYNFSFFDFIFCLKSIRKKDQPFELLFDLFDNRNIFFVNHARTGLRKILDSLSLPEGSKIGVQAYNCHTVFQAIKKAGFQSVFIDINESFTINPDDLKKKKDKIDALIVTHTFGIPADFDEIKKIVYDIPIIEDCAHAFLSKYKNKLTGTLGDAAIFSFGHGKFPSIGNGGFFIVNRKDILEKIKNNYNKLPEASIKYEARQILKSLVFSIVHKRPLYGIFSKSIGKIINNHIDLNDKFTFEEYKGLYSYISLFFKKFSLYNSYLADQKNNGHSIILEFGKKFKFIQESEIKKINLFMLPILTQEGDDIMKKFEDKGIELGKHFSKSIEWAKQYGYKNGSCKNAEKITKEVLTIPSYYRYPKSKLGKINYSLNEVVKNENSN